MLIISYKALEDIIQESHQKMGVQIEIAKAIAQAFVNNSESHIHWSNWFLSNCTSCSKLPETCDFFEVEKEVLGANIHCIKKGSLRICPLKEGRNVPRP